MSSGEREFRGWTPEILAGAVSSSGSKAGGGPTIRRGKSDAENVSPSSGPASGLTGGGIGEDLFFRSEEVDRVENEARQAGFDAGYVDGKKAAVEEIEPLREAFIAWAAQIPGYEKERLRSLVPVVVTLLETAFRNMLGEDLDRPESLKRLIERMVGEHAGGRTADLVLSESDYRQVLKIDPEFQKELRSRGVHLEIGPDLVNHKIELRFPDRIVSFDPEEAATSLRRSLSRASSSQNSDTQSGNSPPGPEEQGGVL